jgi:hypothetical protein
VSAGGWADWLAHLPWVMLGLRSSPKEDTNILAAELVFGAPLMLSGEFLASPQASVLRPWWNRSALVPLSSILFPTDSSHRSPQ